MTGVNTFVPMNAEKADTPGSRLRAYIERRWSRRLGGMRGLAERMGTSAETLYQWFSDKREPNLDHLARLAEVLSDEGPTVTRAELVAVMDGGAPLVPLDAETEALMRQIVEQVLDERLGRR